MVLICLADTKSMFKEKSVQFFSYLLEKSSHSSALFALSKLLDRKIAFNAPHKFKITKLEVNHVLVSLPLIRLNTNHLGTVHACAMATVGEYPAGLVLIKNFGFNKYRLILKDLNIKFTKQATTNLSAEVRIDDNFIPQLKEKLAKEDSVQIELCTIIKNDQSEVVAEVLTTWHLKNWESVKFIAS